MAERRTTRSYAHDYSHEVDTFDSIDYGLSLGQRLPDTAQKARDLYAVSYREEPFLVGAALLATNALAHRVGLFWGWNNTPRPGASKFCAEMRATQTSKGYDRKDILVVAGPYRPELLGAVNEHGLVTSTLLPCKLCREGDHLDHGTLLLTFREKLNAFQAWTGADAHAMFNPLDPPKHVGRQKRPQLYIPPPQPELIEIGDDPIMFWAHTRKGYQERRSDIQEDTEEDFRIASARAAVDSMYEAAKAA
jgi:hypothetical protein